MGKRRRRSESGGSQMGEKSHPPKADWLRIAHPRLAALALVLVVTGARWWLIAGYSADVPWLDQWDAEAQGLYRPLHSGSLPPGSWFAPHNEHRIFFTRVLDAGLFWLNGQWDPRLQMAVNAALYALVFGWLFLVLRKDRPPGFQIFCWVLLAVLGSAPYGSTNTLLGFQSQFYFLAGFSLFAIHAVANARPGSVWWFAGVVSGGAALVSMASGHAAAAAVLAVLVCAAVRSADGVRVELGRRWIPAVAACGLIAAGMLLRYSPPQHAELAAKSAGDFGRLLLACLSWPGSPNLLLAAITWLPFGAFLALYLKTQAPDDSTERFVLGIGFWALIQAAGLAVYRANSGEGLESRYTDILAFGLLANAVCVVWLVGKGGRLRRWMPVFATGWFVIGGAGLYSKSFDGSAWSLKNVMEIRRAATAGFVATGDRRYLEQAPAYHDVNRLAAFLTDPALRPILPAGIRKPVELAPRNGSPAPEMVNGLSSPDLADVRPGVWTSPGMFARFAVIPPSTKFEYGIAKQSALPSVLLYVVGDANDLAVIDGQGGRRWIVPLPGQGGGGHHAFVACPDGCVVRGSSGSSRSAIAEPKELGRLSAAALMAVLWGERVMGAGAFLFLALLAAPGKLKR